RLRNTGSTPGALIHLPAVSEWPDFDDGHVKARCILLQLTLPVRLNMSEPNNGQGLSPKDNRPIAPKGSQTRYTGELLLRTRPKTYRAIARELAGPDASGNGVSRRYRVSNHTVIGIREREAKSIAERKNTLAVKLANVAEIGAERMEEMIGNTSLHDTTIATGVATDKVIALTSQTPSINIVNVPMPSAEERAELTAIDSKLDAIAAKLKASSVVKPQPARERAFQYS